MTNKISSEALNQNNKTISVEEKPVAHAFGRNIRKENIEPIQGLSGSPIPHKTLNEFAITRSDQSSISTPLSSDQQSPELSTTRLGDVPNTKDMVTEVILFRDGDGMEEPAGRLSVERHLSQDAEKTLVSRSRSMDKEDEEAYAIYQADHREAEFLSTFDNPENIIEFIAFEASSSSDELTTTLYMADAGINALEAAKSLDSMKTVNTLKQWSQDLAQGLVELKAKMIIHRDIKPENLLIDPDPDDNRLRIADLGNACDVTKEGLPNDSTGTAFYASPEAKEGQFQGFESDIYSAGLSLLRIFMEAGLIKVGSWTEFCIIRDQGRPIPLHPDYKGSDTAKTLLETSQRMISSDTTVRPDAEELVKIFTDC
ncbi:MAG: protein kinase family protein [Endozoicomonas sp. (ex Botrylloides leachii)]|nr:protein kinase family protein [Endozoicomonas sp. (ex Botrylloides leachii)]